MGGGGGYASETNETKKKDCNPYCTQYLEKINETKVKLVTDWMCEMMGEYG